jgi:hypothetical protein
MSAGVRLHVPSLTPVLDLFLHRDSMKPDLWMIRLRHQSLKYSTIRKLIQPARAAFTSVSMGSSPTSQLRA